MQSTTERKITREGAREVCCQDKEEARGWVLGVWRHTGRVGSTTPDRNRVDSETGGAGVSSVTTKNNSSLSITANLLIYPPPMCPLSLRDREIQSTPNRRHLQCCVCWCVRTSLFIVQTGYAVFPGKDTARKQNTSYGNTLRERTGSGK